MKWHISSWLFTNWMIFFYTSIFCWNWSADWILQSLFNHVEVNLKSQFLIKSSYYIVPSPSTALINNNHIIMRQLRLHLCRLNIFFFSLSTKDILIIVRGKPEDINHWFFFVLSLLSTMYCLGGLRFPSSQMQTL